MGHILVRESDTHYESDPSIGKKIRFIAALVFPFLLLAILVPRCDDFWPLVFGYADEDSGNKEHPIPRDQDRPPQKNTDSATDPQGGDHDSGDPEPMDCIPTTIYTFINEINDYNGCTDTQLQQRYPGEAKFSDVSLIASRLTDSGYPYTSKSQILIRMDGLFGYAAAQIPLDAKIANASLTLFTTDASSGDLTIHRMLTSWDAGTTWNTLGGVTPNGEEAAAESEDVISNPGIGPSFSFDVTESLTLWQTDPSQNLGWVIINNSDDPWHTVSCETNLVTRRPRLDVEVCGIHSSLTQNLPPEILSSADSERANLYASASALLDVVVVDPDENPMDVTFFGREKGTEFWTIIVLPDTQYYTLDTEWPKGIFSGQTRWIVEPDMQRQGIGRQMMDAAEHKLRQLDCPKINLQVRRTNTDVIAFYQHLGFTEDDVASLGKRL